jgi:Pin2-interacting protein X1
MTFEASRKKQVLVLQPKGKALYEGKSVAGHNHSLNSRFVQFLDDSSFGSKMMAKMGWNKGSGLGKDQHGSVDFIQIRYKNNANGLGFDGLKDNQWTENESQFDNLLKALNGNAESNSNSADEQQPPKSKSLEEQSKLSRARVHYKKFTKGKDVHRYSEKDLANILGKKTLVAVEETPQVEETAEIVEDDK